jgi:hypothetical protein
MDVRQIRGAARTLVFYECTIRGIETPIELNYYSSPNRFASPVKTIPQGAMIVIDPIIGVGFSGLTSFPTYTGGWRYAKPSLVVSDEDIYWPMTYYDFNGVFSEWRIYPILMRHYHEMEAFPYLFIRTEDIMVVYDEFIMANDWGTATHEVEFTESLTRTYSGAFINDIALFRRGDFISPDLLEPVFDRLNIFWAAMAFVIIVGYAVLRKWKTPIKTVD